MRALICATLIITGIINSVFSNNKNTSFKYSISREQIAHAGLVRLSDVFFLIDEFNYFTIDGFTWQYTFKEFDLYQQQNWILMIDDQTTPTKIFDTVQINLLPLSIDQLDSVEVYYFPQQTGAEFSDKGIIHIHTRAMDRGITIQGLFTAGNRTGDPGPYRYTEYWTENVDRVAADESYWGSYADSVMNIGFGHYVQFTYPTDPRMADRLREIYTDENPFISSSSYTIRAAFPKFPGKPQLSFFKTKMENLYFFKPAGREIPVIHNLISAGISGKDRLLKNMNINYRFNYYKYDLEKRPNAYNYNFDWGIEIMQTDIHVQSDGKNHKSIWGIGTKKTAARTGYSLSDNNFYEAKFFGSYFFNGFEKHFPGISAMLGFGSNGQRIKFSVLDQYQLSSSSEIVSALSYSEESIFYEINLWYWYNNGYDFISETGGIYQAPNPLKPSAHWTFDLSFKSRESRLPAVEAGICVRHFVAKNWESQNLGYQQENSTVSGPVLIRSYVSSNRGCIYIKVDHRKSKFFNHHLYYKYSAMINSARESMNLWQTIPNHRLIYRITFMPAENFSIWSMFNYQSSTFWMDYKEVNTQSDGLYSARITDIVSVDVAVNKWLWNRQIKLDFILRNIFDAPNIYFPIGASFNLYFYAQAELYLNFL